jgi:hypothetical protein
MKKILTCLLGLLAVIKVSAQSAISLELKSSSGPNLEIWATPTNFNAGDKLSGVVLTIKWSTTCGVSLGSLTNNTALTLMKAYSETSGGFNYSIISDDTQTEIIPTNGVAVKLATIPITGTPLLPNCTFDIDPSFISGSNAGEFYIAKKTATNTVDITTASSFTGSGNVVLPTELLSFKGIKKGKVSQLQWEATNEKNLVNYIIERSSDGKNFHPVGFTKPRAATATEKVAYDFIDDQPEIGINYYRLLSKGLGKDEKYSKVISLDFGIGLSGKVYPNPLDGDLIIDLDIEGNSGEVEVGIFDIVGKQVLSRKIQNNDRRINSTLPTSDLPPGMYVVKVKVGSFNWERQITKM